MQSLKREKKFNKSENTCLGFNYRPWYEWKHGNGNDDWLIDELIDERREPWECKKHEKRKRSAMICRWKGWEEGSKEA